MAQEKSTDGLSNMLYSQNNARLKTAGALSPIIRALAGTTSFCPNGTRKSQRPIRTSSFVSRCGSIEGVQEAELFGDEEMEG